jgi:hypothetical protein
MENDERVGIEYSFYDATDNLRFAKQQQWSTAYYVLLIYGAVIGFHSVLVHAKAPVSPWWLIAETIGVLMTAVFGIIFMMKFQGWIKKSRTRLKRIYSLYASEAFLSVRRNLPQNDSFWRDWQILLGIVAIELCGAAAIIVFLWSA